MPEREIICSTDSSPTSWDQLEAGLRKQGITLTASVQKIFRDLVTDGEMADTTTCYAKDTPEDGPFLMVVKVLFPDKGKYATLLNQLTGDDTLALLFEPSGPAYVRVLRCRPSFWERLKQSCMKLLGWVQ